MAGDQPAAPAARPGHWFPLLVFGGLAALSLPLSVLLSPRLMTPSRTAYFVLVRVVYPTVPQAMYLGGGSCSPPFPFPLGWYWAAVLVAGFPLTAAWYRWRGRRAASPVPLRGFLVTGLVLAAATAALPLLAWGTPVPLTAALPPAWLWLNDLWRLGTAALLVIAAGLAVLARSTRSRPLAVVAVVYAAAVCLTGWIGLQPLAVMVPAVYPFGDPLVVLPAGVLLAAGLGALAVTGIRALRTRTR